MAPPGYVFWERDYAAMEPTLVGYFAGSRRYVRAARVGIHALVTSHLVGTPADFGWDDTRLGEYLRVVKKTHPATYDIAKRIVNGSNYKMTPRKMHYEYPEHFKSTKDAARLQSLYFDLFPEIREWHRELCLRVDGTKRRRVGDTTETLDPWTLGVCFAKNPFGYVHRFYNVLDWTKVDGKWESSDGEDAKRLVADLPQSTGAGIIKRVMRTLWYEYPWVGETLRLPIYDAMFGECREEELDQCLTISQQVMEAPIPELPLDPTWGMGDHLTIGSEAKVGKSWASMQPPTKEPKPLPLAA